MHGSLVMLEEGVGVELAEEVHRSGHLRQFLLRHGSVPSYCIEQGLFAQPFFPITELPDYEHKHLFD